MTKYWIKKIREKVAFVTNFFSCVKQKSSQFEPQVTIFKLVFVFKMQQFEIFSGVDEKKLLIQTIFGSVSSQLNTSNKRYYFFVIGISIIFLKNGFPLRAIERQQQQKETQVELKCCYSLCIAEYHSKTIFTGSVETK